MNTQTLDVDKNSSILADDFVVNTGLFVMMTDCWLPSTFEVWRSFTGRRAIWGFEHHGPVYEFGSDSNVPWTGPRVCGCIECQRHVRSSFKSS